MNFMNICPSLVCAHFYYPSSVLSVLAHYAVAKSLIYSYIITKSLQLVDLIYNINLLIYMKKSCFVVGTEHVHRLY